MSITTRPAMAEDAEACGHIMFDAFRGVANAHGFPPDFPSAEGGAQLAAALIATPSVFAIVAESGGRVVGFNFLAEGSAILTVEPITVDPDFQGGRVGRRLLKAVLEGAKGTPGGWLVLGRFPSPPQPLGRALSALRTVRNGGHPWTDGEVEALLVRVGFASVEHVPTVQIGLTSAQH